MSAWLIAIPSCENCAVSQGCCLWDACSSPTDQLLGNSCRSPAWAGCSPADLLATLGPGAVPGLRFGAPGSACLHIGVASAVPGRDGETPSDRLLLGAACPGWDETSRPHPQLSRSPAGWCGGWGDSVPAHGTTGQVNGRRSSPILSVVGRLTGRVILSRIWSVCFGWSVVGTGQERQGQG